MAQEVERKFVMRRWPEGYVYTDHLWIQQFYLNDHIRIRRTHDANYGNIKEKGALYEHMTKVYTRPGVSEELDIKKITKEHFEMLSREAKSMIRKHRFVYLSGDHKYEIDDFEDVRLLMMEIEMPEVIKQRKVLSVDEWLAMPYRHLMPAAFSDEVLLEVTGIEHFSNRNLAKRLR